MLFPGRLGLDITTLLFLTQDGIINGTIYALAGIALVLVFAVTRVILVPQGEFIAFGAMTVAAFEAGEMPATVWLLLVLGGLATVATLIQERHTLGVRMMARIGALYLLLPALPAYLSYLAVGTDLGAFAHIALAIALIVPMGPMMYRLAFAPMANASVLVLLIAAFGVHMAFMGLGLIFFGAEGVATRPLITRDFSFGNLLITGQSVAVVSVAAMLLVAFALFFGRTLLGKALRACSSNRLGARLAGVPTVVAGEIVFALAAAMGAVAGVLTGPIVTTFYDSGFLIGLKAFVAAIIGGLVSFPLTVVASLCVGIVEAFSSYWLSNYKEVMVFSLILPVLLWRSFYTPMRVDED